MPLGSAHDWRLLTSLHTYVYITYALHCYVWVVDCLSTPCGWQYIAYSWMHMPGRTATSAYYYTASLVEHMPDCI
jgi:hypothetical protein